MPHKEIMQQIGRLFILRMNINLVGSVLDAPVSLSLRVLGFMADHDLAAQPLRRYFG